VPTASTGGPSSGPTVENGILVWRALVPFVAPHPEQDRSRLSSIDAIHRPCSAGQTRQRGKPRWSRTQFMIKLIQDPQVGPNPLVGGAQTRPRSHCQRGPATAPGAGPRPSGWRAAVLASCGIAGHLLGGCGQQPGLPFSRIRSVSGEEESRFRRTGGRRRERVGIGFLHTWQKCSIFV
jgi:hypothetical protein